MIRMIRILGVLLIVVGVVVIGTWMIEPLREIVPEMIKAFQALPIAVQAGLIIAAVGFLLLLSSLIWERMEDRKSEGDLLDD